MWINWVHFYVHIVVKYMCLTNNKLNAIYMYSTNQPVSEFSPTRGMWSWTECTAYTPNFIQRTGNSYSHVCAPRRRNEDASHATIHQPDSNNTITQKHCGVGCDHKHVRLGCSTWARVWYMNTHTVVSFVRDCSWINASYVRTCDCKCWVQQPLWNLYIFRCQCPLHQRTIV